MIPFAIVKAIENSLDSRGQHHDRVEECHAVGGGSINQACRFSYGQQSFFIKWNNAGRYPDMFAREASGLEMLRTAGGLRIPEVIGHGTAGPYAYLLLEYIRQAAAQQSCWRNFGLGLARLHRFTSAHYGFHEPNYIGSLPQQNQADADWATFFVNQRLEPQLKLARDQGLTDASLSRMFATLFSKMDQLFPVGKPSLLHGDLWQGNMICDESQQPVLIDPAVYFGHREMDIAMTKLFGGFSPEWIAAYEESWPLDYGWKDRIGLCNLYPLMVHLNLFGDAYLGQVKRALSYYAG